MGAYGGLEDAERAGGELVLFELRNFILAGRGVSILCRDLREPVGTHVSSLRGFANSSLNFN